MNALGGCLTGGRCFSGCTVNFLYGRCDTNVTEWVVCAPALRLKVLCPSRRHSSSASSVQGTGGIKVNPTKFLLFGGWEPGLTLESCFCKNTASQSVDATRLVQTCRQLREPVGTRKRTEAGVGTGEEEGLRKNTGGESVCEEKTVQRPSDLSDVPNQTVILSNDDISLITRALGYGCTVCIWQ